ncbi:hypothetical protein TNCV_440981 [Trichonephila clavipes]|nr:hypothetical protein TNCV_440981 [Trichonephila clavipes]
MYSAFAAWGTLNSRRAASPPQVKSPSFQEGEESDNRQQWSSDHVMSGTHFLLPFISCKWKIFEENRLFQDDWEVDYFVVKNKHGSVIV